MIILVTAIFALVLAFALGTALGFFREFFAVPEDPMVGNIREVLPGANCGACGYPGCDNYAAAAKSIGVPFINAGTGLVLNLFLMPANSSNESRKPIATPMA